jgi:hypothetical protein
VSNQRDPPLLSLTGNLQILSEQQVKMTTLVVAISMLLTPIVLLAYEYAASKRNPDSRSFDEPVEMESTKHVIIAGYGRLLTAQGYHLAIPTIARRKSILCDALAIRFFSVMPPGKIC